MNQIKKITIVLALAMLLSACAVRTAYNYADWYLAWKVDDYVTLNDSQELAFEQAVDEFINWHRRQELPRYKRMLTELKAAVNSSDVEQLERVYGEMSGIWQTAVDYATPSIILLLNKLSQEQKQELLSNIVEQQQQAREKQKQRAKKTTKNRDQQGLDNLTEMLGELSAEQKAAYLAMRQSYINTREMRAQSQQLWITKFEQGLATEQLDQLALYQLFTEPSSYRSSALIKALAFNQAQYYNFLASNLPKLSVKQKQTLIEQIDDYVNDINYLIGQS